MVDLLTFDTEVRRSIVQEITAGDTTHAPSGDAVHDALSEKVDKETGKGLFSGSYNDLTDKPTIPTVPSASTTTPSADTTNGDVGDGTTWARSNHKHPKSSLYAEASHSHTVSDLPTANSITDGDTTHIVTADVIHDYIDEIIGDADDWLTS